jgi:hypothetical protein
MRAADHFREQKALCRIAPVVSPSHVSNESAYGTVETGANEPWPVVSPAHSPEGKASGTSEPLSGLSSPVRHSAIPRTSAGSRRGCGSGPGMRNLVTKASGGYLCPARCPGLTSGKALRFARLGFGRVARKMRKRSPSRPGRGLLIAGQNISCGRFKAFCGRDGPIPVFAPKTRSWAILAAIRPLPRFRPRTTGELSVLSTGIGPPGRRWVKAPPDSMVVRVVHPGWRFSPRFRPGLFFCRGRAMKPRLVTTLAWGIHW